MAIRYLFYGKKCFHINIESISSSMWNLFHDPTSEVAQDALFFLLYEHPELRPVGKSIFLDQNSKIEALQEKEDSVSNHLVKTNVQKGSRDFQSLF